MTVLGLQLQRGDPEAGWATDEEERFRADPSPTLWSDMESAVLEVSHRIC